MLERMRSTGAAAIGFWWVWGVACGDTGSSDQASSDQGSPVTDGGGTAGTTVGGVTTSSVAGTSSSSGGGSTSSTGGSGTDGPVTSAGASTTGRAGAGTGGSDASGGDAGSGGAGAELVDCGTDPCSDSEVCVPSAAGCNVTLGQCFAASEAFCTGGAVCGCDGVIYDNRCEAYRAHVALDRVSECEQPAGTIACVDRYCDAGTESCQVVNESRCDGACLALCPGRHTVTYGACVPALPTCDAAECECSTCLSPAAACTEGDDGITIVCSSGCVG